MQKESVKVSNNNPNFSSTTLEEEDDRAMTAAIRAQARLAEVWLATDRQRDGSARYVPAYADTMVGKRGVVSMIDTGAAVSLVTEGLARILHQAGDATTEALATPLSIKGVGGSTVPVLGRMTARLQLAGAVVREAVWLVVRAIHGDFELLLGNDLLAATQSTIDFETMTVRAGDRQQSFAARRRQHATSGNSSALWLVQAQEAFVIDPRQQLRVRARLKGGMEGMAATVLVEPSTAQNHFPDGVLLMPTLDRHRERCVNVLLVNTSLAPVTIESGAVLGVATNAGEDVEVEMADEEGVEPVVAHVTAAPSGPTPPASSAPSNGPKADAAALKLLREQLEQQLHLTAEQRKRVWAVVEEYDSLWQMRLKQPGQALPGGVQYQHRIHTGDAAPVRSPQRPISAAKADVLRQQLHELESTGAIEPAPESTPWRSMAVLLKKKDGSARLAIDYRSLNAITTKDAYNIPTISSILDRLAGARFFTSLDMASGFHQILVHPDDRQKTAFSVPAAAGGGLYVWRVLPEGVTNGPSSFQRAMDLVLAGLHGFALPYLDDVLIFSRTFDEHIQHLRAVFGRLLRAGMVVKAAKTRLAREQLLYLGHIISARGVEANPALTASVREAAPPTDLATLRSFLGLSGYFRRFVPRYAAVVEPLTALTRSGVPYLWGESQQKAFEEIKRLLTSPPILALPERGAEMRVETDASGTHAAGAIYQRSAASGLFHPMAYWSATFDESQRRWSPTDRECAAVIWALKEWDYLLEGERFTLVTDHSALRYLREATTRANGNGRLIRWAIWLSAYGPFEIVHRSGKTNVVADYLSRPAQPRATPTATTSTSPTAAATTTAAPTVAAVTTRSAAASKSPQRPRQQPQSPSKPIAAPPPPPPKPSPPPLPPKPLPKSSAAQSSAAQPATADTVEEDTREVLDAQRRDPLCKELRDFLLEKKPVTSKRAQNALRCGTFHIDEKTKLLVRLESRGGGLAARAQLVLPDELHEQVLRRNHDEAAHVGPWRLRFKLLLRYWWPTLAADCNAWATECEECQRHNSRVSTPHYGLLQSIVVTRPNERVGADLVGPLPTTAAGNKYLLVAVDHFTKWAVAVALTGIEASMVADALVQHWFHPRGPPQVLQSDRGGQFVSELMAEVLRKYGIEKRTTTSFHPSGNGMVERVNGEITEILKKRVGLHHDKWDLMLSDVVRSYNAAPHSSLGGKSPYRVETGRDYPEQGDHVADRATSDPPRSIHDYIERREEVQKATEEEVRKSIAEKQQKQKIRYDKDHCAFDLKKGDLVKLDVRAKKENKLSANFEGPYTIVEIHGGGRNCTIQHVNNAKDRQIVHVSRVSRWNAPRTAEPLVAEEEKKIADDSDAGPDRFEVKDIIAVRERSQRRTYRVRWKGYTPRHDSWVREEDLDAPDILRRFYRLHGQEVPPPLRIVPASAMQGSVPIVRPSVITRAGRTTRPSARQQEGS